MKRIKAIIAIMILPLISFGQNESDALRYSQNFNGGTARYMSMGGAFGALGGDVTSLSYNPAGLGVFRATEITFTPTLFYNRAESSYLNENRSDFKYNFNLNNVGFVAAYGSDDQEGWKSLNLAFGYNRLNNFHSNRMIQGVNLNNSITDYFANVSDGYSSDILEVKSPFVGDLAWWTFLTDTAAEGNYNSILPNYGEVQRQKISTEGSIGEYAFSVGANYNHQLYIGATLGIQDLRYEEYLTHTEYDPADDIEYFDEMVYKRRSVTEGTGYNLKLGVIFKPAEFLRIGGAIHTPTFFQLEDRWSTYMENSIWDTIYSKESPKGRYEYNLTTPLKSIGSIAFIIKKKALVSLDYEHVDYTTMRFSAHDYDFDNENNAIQDSYKAAGNIKTGVEYRLGNISLRGGYAYYGSPYADNQLNKDASRSSYSGGIGIRDESFFFDVAYVYSTYSEKSYLYDPTDIAGIQPANIDFNTSKIMFTLGFRY